MRVEHACHLLAGNQNAQISKPRRSCSLLYSKFPLFCLIPFLKGKPCAHTLSHTHRATFSMRYSLSGTCVLELLTDCSGYCSSLWARRRFVNFSTSVVNIAVVTVGPDVDTAVHHPLCGRPYSAPALPTDAKTWPHVKHCLPQSRCSDLLLPVMERS